MEEIVEVVLQQTYTYSDLIVCSYALAKNQLATSRYTTSILFI